MSKTIREIVAFSIGFGVAYWLAPGVSLPIAFILALHNGFDDPTTVVGQAWWIAFFIVGLPISGAVLMGLQIGNVLNHASDRADKERQ